MKKDGWFAALQNLTWLTQLGLSLAVPPLLCLFGAGWLARRFSLGPWVWVLGILLGLGAAGCTFAEFARMFLRRNGSAQKGGGPDDARPESDGRPGRGAPKAVTFRQARPEQTTPSRRSYEDTRGDQT